MLSENFDLETPTKKAWPLLPADVYQTEITNIEEKIEPNKWRETPTDPETKKYINFEFTVIEEGPLYGRKVWQKMSPVKPYPPYGNGKESWMYRLASAVMGHPIAKEEADYFGVREVNAFLGKQVRVTVKHSAPNAQGKQYANVEGFLSVKSALPAFDENKVPKENQPEQSGYDKFKEAAAEIKEAVEITDIKVEDIPF